MNAKFNNELFNDFCVLIEDKLLNTKTPIKYKSKCMSNKQLELMNVNNTYYKYKNISRKQKKLYRKPKKYNNANRYGKHIARQILQENDCKN